MSNKSKFFIKLGFYSFIVGVLLILVSFFLPPTGTIDPSAIKAAGMIFTFGAILEGLYTGKVIKITHKDTQVYIGDKDNIGE